MTGTVRFVGPDMYVEVNDSGTLEKLPRVKWWRQLHLAISTAIKPWNLDAVRTYCKAHGRFCR